MNQVRLSKLLYVLLLFVLVACQAQATAAPMTAPLPPTAVPPTAAPTVAAAPAQATNPQLVEYQVPTSASEPGGMVAGPDGALWFVETAVNKIGRISTDGVVTEYSVPTAGAIDTDQGIPRRRSGWRALVQRGFGQQDWTCHHRR